MKNHLLKVVVLAARPEGAALKLLEPLGDKPVIDYVIALALKFVAPKDLCIVVHAQDSSVQAHLGDAFQYVEQSDPAGTGHAVLQTAEHLKAHSGDLLILYGDTPLFRRASILGMLNRHQLTDADMTLLTADSDQILPYGRVIRDSRDQIIDIIEDADASGAMQQIQELNLGAYVARASKLFGTLQHMERDRDGRLRLTDSVHQLVRANGKIESFKSHDPDEILGINTAEDLKQAEFILQKRQFRPHKADEDNEIRFGTGGWRAVIGEGFTMDNVRRLCQSLANQIIRANKESQGVLIGYDRRFLSDRAAEVATEIFTGNNIPVLLLSEDVPTPLVTYATDLKNAVYGLVFTASHNPPEWNGLKVFHHDGSLLLTDETNRIETEANGIQPDAIVKLELDLALQAGIAQYADFTNEYVDAVEKHIVLAAIREANLHIVLDPMYGTGQGTLNTVLTEARCRVTTIHGRHDPLFGGRSPAPDLGTLGMLIATVKDGDYDLGMAMDGDADRIAIVDELGEFIHINDLLLLLYYYLHEVKGMRGGVVRNLATTHLLDRLAAHFGEKSIETPVGFKHIVQGMQSHNALLGGESSGGLTIRGHILGKDGIFASALIVEMLAVTNKKVSELRQIVYEITGRLYTQETNFPATSEMKVIVPQRLQAKPVTQIGQYPVVDISYEDGTKFRLKNDNWLLLRFSGTEPVLRIFAEADTPEKAAELTDWAKEIVSL
ncbi:MAG: NTP transferase domain-containing protein [Anaerolineae bacterium]